MLHGALSYSEPDILVERGRRMDVARRSTLKIKTLTTDDIRKQLLTYEQQYGMSSIAFYARYCAGEFPEFPDVDDFFTWETLYLMGMDDPRLADLCPHR